MRDFKFRAWDKKENKMFEVKNINFHNEFLNCNPKLPMQHCQCLQFKNCVLLQFTGLKDINGVEIYEGDIIQRVDGSLREVFYDAPYWNLRIIRIPGVTVGSFSMLDDMYKGCKVLGNRFENPELLKEEE